MNVNVLYTRLVITVATLLLYCKTGPVRAPQYSYSGTSGYDAWRGGGYTPQQPSAPAPPVYERYTAGLNEEEQIAEATRQSLRNGENCVSLYSIVI